MKINKSSLLIDKGKSLKDNFLVYHRESSTRFKAQGLIDLGE